MTDHEGPEFWLFLPQMRMSLDAMLERAQAAEAAGFTGIALMDHLAPPLAESQPMYEAMTLAMWLLANTETLSVGHLVLCDAMRQPAVLAREVVTLDHASKGRFELGLGWGSVPAELELFGVGSSDAKVRVGRMEESLEVMRALWTGEPVTYEGEHFRLTDAQQQPTPLGHVPITIGGSGKRTLEMVRRHADWCNLPVNKIEQADEVRAKIGDARLSTQNRVTYISADADRADVEVTAQRRFGDVGRLVGDGGQLVDQFGALHARGIDRFYAWFTDFAAPETLAGFGSEVIGSVS
jgi:alkanesulfonate monooxygenase SsuD/methylene tetrahydromethanopterin reductase-like flavin-dependent oxidoreductase (luciferase family)